MSDIAKLNDYLRQSIPALPQPHKLMLSESVASLPRSTMATLFHAIKTFQNFTEGSDPYSEHDFGSLFLEGEKYFWKFDYFDDDFEFFKENGNRVLTIMNAAEY